MTRVDQGFSTNKKFQCKESTIQRTVGTKCLSLSLVLPVDDVSRHIHFAYSPPTDILYQRVHMVT